MFDRWPLLLLIASACGGTEPYRLAPAPGLDLYMPIPAANPLTREKIELGRALFFDPILSADRSVSCASCHQPERAFSSPEPRAVGVYGRVGSRNAPTLINVAHSKHLSWDGREPTLEAQVLRPVPDPLEMGLDLDEALARLRALPRYGQAFRRAFAADVSAERLAYALASYVRTIRSGDSPRDRYYANDTLALSQLARAGMRLFIGKANCAACHLGPLLSDDEFHNTGVSWGDDDAGRHLVTGDEADRGAFNTPTLRNVVCTAPYMHDGSIGTLEEVIEHYDAGGTGNPNLDQEIRPLSLTADEKQALAAFLRALSGRDCGETVSE